MKKLIVLLSLCLLTWTFFMSFNSKEEPVMEDEIQLEKHIIEDISNDYVFKDYSIEDIEENYKSEEYSYYYSYSRASNGIHYDKVYTSFDSALEEAKQIHQLSPYNEYNTYTIEGLPQCGYKIYFIQ